MCCWSVGLVQRLIEAAGITTICLSNIPDFTAAVGAPRIAAIEYPMGHTMGQPGDRSGQLDVLRSTLAALSTIDRPGERVDLPYEWPESPREVLKRRHVPPPITTYLRRHPWQLRKFFCREVPEQYLVTPAT